MAGYGPSPDINYDPVLAARRALFDESARADAAGQAGLDSMDDRAAYSFEHGGANPNDISLPPITTPLPPMQSARERFPTTAIPGAQRVSTPDAPKGDPAARTTPRQVPGDATSFGGLTARAVSDPIEMRAPGVAERAFVDTPDPWNPSGRARSAAQLVSDTNARALLDSAYEPAYARIARDAARTDPMGHAIEARRKTLEYESMMPAGMEPVLRSSHAPRDLPSIAAALDAEGQPLYDAEQGQRGVTQGQMLDFEKQVGVAQAKAYDPKAMLSVQSAAARQQELQNIGAARAQMLSQVKTGQMKPAEFDSRMRKLIIESAERGALLEGDVKGLAALLYPKAEDLLANDTTPGRQ